MEPNKINIISFLKIDDMAVLFYWTALYCNKLANGCIKSTHTKGSAVRNGPVMSTKCWIMDTWEIGFKLPFWLH